MASAAARSSGGSPGGMRLPKRDQLVGEGGMKDSATDPPPQGGAGSHGVTLTLCDPFPPEVEAGATVVTRVRAWCAAGCDLRGAPLRVEHAGNVVAEAALEESDAGDGPEASLSWKAPAQVGEWAGAVVFSRSTTQTEGKALHDDVSLDVRCRVVPHPTSLAVWSA